MEENNDTNEQDTLGVELRSLKESFSAAPSMETLLRIVDTYHKMKQTERGIGFAEAFLMQIEDEKDRYLQTSMVFEMVDRNQEALSYLKEAADRFPDDVMIQNHYGMLLNKLSEFGKSLHIYDSMLESNPNSLESLAGKLIALAGLGRHGDILKLYKISIGITPSSVQEWHFKGVIDGILEDYFQHEKGASITEGQADRLSQSFASIKHVIEGLGPKIQNLYVMGSMTGKEIYREIQSKIN